MNIFSYPNSEFPEDLEKDYQSDLGNEKIKAAVEASFLTVLLFSIYGIIEILFHSAGINFTTIIRLYVVLTASSVILISRYRKNLFFKYYSAIIIYEYIIMGLAVEIVRWISTPPHLYGNMYHEGLILVSFAIYTTTYLNPGHSIFTGTFLIASQIIVSVILDEEAFGGNLKTTSRNLFFLIGANFIGLISKNLMNRFSRSAFLLKQNLLKDIDERKIIEEKLRSMASREKEAERLEAMVAQRTAELNQKTKELISANEAKNKFFSILAHDLKGPIGNLSVIFNNILKPEDLPDENKNLLEIIRQSTKTTYELLEDILTWARSQKNEIEFRPSIQNLHEKIKQIIEIFKLQAKSKKIHISVKIQSALYVHADPFMLSTIFRNLINNALKFTDEEGEITIDAEKKDNMIEISIKDTGIGIEEKELPLIFKLDRSYKIKHPNQGTGLGLILCKEFIEKHGGQIQVESKPGDGSCFTFSLPEAKFNFDDSLIPFSGMRFSDLKILLAEDNPLHYEVSYTILSSLGCKIHHAENGQQAVDMAAKEQYDIILMDLEMPVKNGMEAAMEIRSSLKSPPIIAALSSYSRNEIRELGMEDGFKIYLQKPVRAEELRSALGCE